MINVESLTVTPKPYRYIIQNGSFVVLETEWSSFVNPWTKSLEFVVGQHRVLKGPSDPNIFHSSGDKKSYLSNISEEVLKEAKIIQKEVSTLLIEVIQILKKLIQILLPYLQKKFCVHIKFNNDKVY